MDSLYYREGNLEEDSIGFWFDNLSRANTANHFNRALGNNNRINSSILQIGTQGPVTSVVGQKNVDQKRRHDFQKSDRDQMGDKNQTILCVDVWFR